MEQSTVGLCLSRPKDPEYVFSQPNGLCIIT